MIVITVVMVGTMSLPSVGRDKPRDLFRMKWAPALVQFDLSSAGMSGAGGQFSKVQIERFSCTNPGAPGDPTAGVKLNCITPELNQDFSPDNEIAVVVDPDDEDHIVVGSNDYYYRFNNSTGARQAIVPTGFFTSFDGGATWKDGQIPMKSGNGAGDPAPAFDREHGVVLMAQLENVGGQSGPWVSQGDVSVSRSTDGGRTWSEPVTVMKGTGTGIGPANQAVFWDKEWLTVDNNPDSPHYGRAYLTSTRFLNTLHGGYAESPIYLSYSDDGGRTWSKPKEISGSHASCTFQSTGPAEECDEDQFSIPAVAPNGDVYVVFINGQNMEEWEVEFDFDSQIMVVKSTNGGVSFDSPVPAAQLEDGLSDMPFSVILRQTVWGHQIRWTPMGSIVVNPTNSNNVTVVYGDRGTPNPNRTELCFLDPTFGGEAPNYDPCNAGPGSLLRIRKVTSTDGGTTWDPPVVISNSSGSQWFPWAGYLSSGTGTLVVAWDEDPASGAQDTFNHVLWNGAAKVNLSSSPEQVDNSVTHWAGQYVTQPNWPVACGGPSDPGKNCNVFHGDYTGLAVDSLNRVHVVWTGFRTFATSDQIDFYTGSPRTGYRQDALYRRVNP